MIHDGQLIGVLDIDSPMLNRFNETDQKYLEQFVQILNRIRCHLYRKRKRFHRL